MAKPITAGELRSVAASSDLQSRVDLLKEWDRQPLDEAALVVLRGICLPRDMYAQKFIDLVTDDDLHALLRYDLEHFSGAHLALVNAAINYWGRRLSNMLLGQPWFTEGELTCMSLSVYPEYRPYWDVELDLERYLLSQSYIKEIGPEYSMNRNGDLVTQGGSLIKVKADIESWSSVLLYKRLSHACLTYRPRNDVFSFAVDGQVYIPPRLYPRRILQDYETTFRSIGNPRAVGLIRLNDD